MSLKKIIEKVNWLEQSTDLLRSACTPWGIKASLTNLDNYGAIFTRDAVMAGIAGVFLKDKTIIEGLKNTLLYLKKLQGKQGQIASNFTIKEGQVDHVSFGTLSPKIDACTWYLIGVGLLVKEGFVQKEVFQESVEQTINLLDALEYNEKHLIYIPKGGNWADEYIYEGYVLYDQVLRAWGLSLLAISYQNEEWSKKSLAIKECIGNFYQKDIKEYFISSFYPGGVFDRFDLAAHTLACFTLNQDDQFIDKTLDWIINEFIEEDKLPPAFYPVIDESSIEWKTLRNYHLFAFKNKPNHYHNGGIWWIWIGWLAVSLSIRKKDRALNRLIEIAFKYLNSLDDFEFDEYISADDLIPNGTKKLCYTATGITMLSLAKNGFDFSMILPLNNSLINEPIQIKEEYFTVSNQIIEKLKKSSLLDKEKLVIGVCGESGSGKSVTAKCLQIALAKENISSVILHQDSYYKLPPKENHEKRKADINHIGANEVKLDLMQTHIDQFKSKATNIMVPVVDYRKNIFLQYDTYIENTPVLIVEGVYAFLLKELDFKVFMARTFKETLEKRKERSREVYDPFVEQVLDIEHQIVLPFKVLSDVIIGEDYKVL